MKILISFLTVLLLSAITYSQQFDESIIKSEMEKYSGSFKAGKINYPGDTNIDVTFYNLDLKLTYSPNYLIGKVTVKAKALNTLTDFFLDLKTALNVDSVKSSGVNVSFTHSDNKINITLERNYLSGEEFEVDVFYQGLPVATGFGSIIYEIHNGTPVMYTLSEPYGANDWWPCKDTPADKADSSEVLITCDENLYAVSNGILAVIQTNPDQTKTYHWKSSYPIAHYLISFAVADYHIYYNYFNYSPTDSMPVIHYIFPDAFSGFQSELDKTTHMLEVFSDRFGLYPFINEKYGHAQFLGGGGMEHQTVSSMGTFNEGLVSHELAHQWFGDQITCRDWHHIWLNEGFATYATGLFYEVKYGNQSYHDYMNGIIPAAKFAQGSVYVQDITDPYYIFDGYRSYSKGAYILHMLRGIVGDSIFFSLLRSYTSSPNLNYGTAVTEDFQAVAESEYGSSLEYFFQEWIYGENYPKYLFNWYSEQTGSGYELRLAVEQELNTSPMFFTMPIKIKIERASGDTTITILNDQQYQQFIIGLTEEPIAVTFDPDNWILKNLTITTNVEGEPADVKYRLEQNYPNPFNPTTIINYSIDRKNSGAFVTLKVYDLLGNEISALVEETKQSGDYTVEFIASDELASGIYFYRLTTGEHSHSKKMLLLK
ncbi:MAG: T9SS type A sorting domain-containing protein [Ignavibacteriales bacterium]|nr:MAG: T9SS type A sorting domain-containing protein [Ignavibacteriales bacterium]